MKPVVLFLLLAQVLPLAAAGEAPAWIEAEFRRMSTALVRRDLAAFLANGTDEAKQALTPEKFSAVCNQIGNSLANGFDTVFLTRARQQGCDVYLWKVTPKDGGDDLFMKLVLENGKVAGFRIF